MPSAAKSILHLTLAGEYRKIPIRCLRKRKEIHPLPLPLLKQVLYHTIPSQTYIQSAQLAERNFGPSPQKLWALLLLANTQ